MALKTQSEFQYYRGFLLNSGRRGWVHDSAASKTAISIALNVSYIFSVHRLSRQCSAFDSINWETGRVSDPWK